MKNLFLILMISLAAVVSSCGKLSVDETLEQAENELQQGNIEVVESYCQTLGDSTATQLTSTQMCRLAILYARLSELSHDHNHMVTATECYERALQMDAAVDSLDNYVNTLDIESQILVNNLREVAQAIKTPCDMSNVPDEQDAFENEE